MMIFQAAIDTFTNWFWGKKGNVPTETSVAMSGALNMISADLSEQGKTFQGIDPSDLGLAADWVDSVLLIDNACILLIKYNAGIVTLSDILSLETCKQDILEDQNSGIYSTTNTTTNTTTNNINEQDVPLLVSYAYDGCSIRTALVASAFEEDAVALAIGFNCTLYQYNPNSPRNQGPSSPLDLEEV